MFEKNNTCPCCKNKNTWPENISTAYMGDEKSLKYAKENNIKTVRVCSCGYKFIPDIKKYV
jgi:hypothetical protein